MRLTWLPLLREGLVETPVIAHRRLSSNSARRLSDCCFAGCCCYYDSPAASSDRYGSETKNLGLKTSDSGSPGHPHPRLDIRRAGGRRPHPARRDPRDCRGRHHGRHGSSGSPRATHPHGRHHCPRGSDCALVRGKMDEIHCSRSRHRRTRCVNDCPRTNGSLAPHGRRPHDPTQCGWTETRRVSLHSRHVNGRGRIARPRVHWSESCSMNVHGPDRSRLVNGCPWSGPAADRNRLVNDCRTTAHDPGRHSDATGSRWSRDPDCLRRARDFQSTCHWSLGCRRPRSSAMCGRKTDEPMSLTWTWTANPAHCSLIAWRR